MTENTLSVPAVKRDRSTGSRSPARSMYDSRVDNGTKPILPAFLTQSNRELRKKFDELEWLQRGRVSAAWLSGDRSHKWALESNPEIHERNRYMNVQAWAHSRIHLKVPEGECDFINASPIALKDIGAQEEMRYIATQGPKEGHLAHFWNMIYHETGEVAVVVMLTQTFEGDREKCAQYFPLDMEKPTLEFSSPDSDPFIERDASAKTNDYLHGTVTLLESSYNERLRSEIRKLRLTLGTESKIVWHYLFAGWSDFMKPEGHDRDALLELTTATAEAARGPSNPRVVHCSAGVGRTGTFIALDHLLRALESGKLLTIADDAADIVFDTVNRLREQRMMMVYNNLQYQFIYEVLKERARALIGGDIDDNPDRPASEPCFEPTPTKDEVEAVVDNVSTPMRSWSGTPEVSDIEP